MSMVLVLSTEQSIHLSSLLGRSIAEYTLWGSIQNAGGQPVVKESLPPVEKEKCQALLDMVQRYTDDDPHVLLDLRNNEVVGVFRSKAEVRGYLELMGNPRSEEGWINKIMHHRHEAYDVQKAVGVTLESDFEIIKKSTQNVAA